jgi:hypothetical protein
MRRLLIATAALATLAAAPALAQSSLPTTNRAAAMAGPGGCEGFNAALRDAVATQIRTGKHAEAQRLMRMFQICGR